ADDYPVTEMAVFDEPAWPKLYFVEKNFNGDESNWWFATRSCLKAMVRTSGFRSVEETANPEIFVCRKYSVRAHARHIHALRRIALSSRFQPPSGIESISV